MAKFNEQQRQWVDEFLGQSGSRGGDGAAIRGLAGGAPRTTSHDQDDAGNGSPRDASQDAVSLMSGQVSADSSGPDEQPAKVHPKLVEMKAPPGVTLPTLHSQIALVAPDGQSRQELPRGKIISRPEYVDNFTKATLNVPVAWDMKNANALKLNLFFSSGNPVGLPWPLLLFQWEQPAYTYNWQFGKIVPVAHDGNILLDKNNTPSIILAALLFKDELDKLAEKYVEIAEITYTVGGAVAASASHMGGMRVGSFSGGKYKGGPRGGAKGGGKTAKPTTGGSRTGTTPKSTTGSDTTGGDGTTGKSSGTGGDSDAVRPTPMKLDDPKGPARSGSGTPTGSASSGSFSGKNPTPGGSGTPTAGSGGGSPKGSGGGAPGKSSSGGSGEKGRTTIKAGEGHGDDADPGKATGKRHDSTKSDSTKTDKSTAGEGRAVKTTSGSKDSKDDGFKGDSDKSTGKDKTTGDAAGGSESGKGTPSTGAGESPTSNPAQPAAKGGAQSTPKKSVLSADKLEPKKIDGSKADRGLSETEIKEARKIAAVLDELNSKNDALNDVNDVNNVNRMKNLEQAKATLRQTPKYRLKQLSGSLSEYWETTLVSDDGAGRGASKMRLLFKIDEKSGKVHSVKIVQMHDQG